MSDKGYGRFGSMEWHKNSIEDLLTIDAIIAYMLILTEQKFIPEHTLKDSKEKAIQMIRGR